MKMYLLEKKDSKNEPLKYEYEFWAGSANATVRGIGWDFENELPKGDSASIECLVKTSLLEGEFNKLKEGIQSEFEAFSFNEDSKGSLQIQKREQFGPWVCANFRVEKLEQKKEKKLLCVTLSSCSLNLVMPKFNSTDCVWRPAEYSQDCSCEARLDEGKWILEYPYEKFRPSQWGLLFGTSAMVIQQSCLKEIDLATDHYVRDTRLSDWMLSSAVMDAVNKEIDFLDTEEDQRAVQYYRWLTEIPTLPGVNDAEELLKEKPMPFQENAANQMVEILKTHSRVFLADEAGLGKTYSVADAVCKMAPKKWQQEGKEPQLYYCIYVAPNKALLKKCAKDFQKKAQGLLNKNGTVMILEPQGDKKEAMKVAIEDWYDRRIKGIPDKEQIKISKDNISKALVDETLSSMGVNPILISNAWKNYCSNITKKGNARSALKDAINHIKGVKWKDFCNIFVENAALAMKKQEIQKFQSKKSEILEKLNEVDLRGVKARGFINGFSGKYAPSRWSDIEDAYSIARMEADRLVNHHIILSENPPAGKMIVLLLVSASCLLDDPKSDIEEKNRLHQETPDEEKIRGVNERVGFTSYFLKSYKINTIIWDEFHRYNKKFDKDIYKKILEYEIESNQKEPSFGLKSIFLSATPYQTNISGSQNQDALEQLYNNLHKKENEENEELTQLPSFEQFAELFCAGYGSTYDAKGLKDTHQKFAACPSNP